MNPDEPMLPETDVPGEMPAAPVNDPPSADDVGSYELRGHRYC